MTIPYNNTLIVEASDKNYLAILLLIVVAITIIYTITSIILQEARISKLKEIIKLIEEGHKRKEKNSK